MADPICCHRIFAHPTLNPPINHFHFAILDDSQSIIVHHRTAISNHVFAIPAKLAPRFAIRKGRTLAFLSRFFPSPTARVGNHLGRLFWPRTKSDSRPVKFRHKVQTRIHRYLVARHARREQKRASQARLLRLASAGRPEDSHTADARRTFGISALRARGSAIWRGRGLYNDSSTISYNRKMTSSGNTFDTYDDFRDREPGTRRRKLAGYLKAANELRQSIQRDYVQPRLNGEADRMPGSFPDVNSARGSGGEEIVIFPSYARRHVKSKVCLENATLTQY